MTLPHFVRVAALFAILPAGLEYAKLWRIEQPTLRDWAGRVVFIATIVFLIEASGVAP